MHNINTHGMREANFLQRNDGLISADLLGAKQRIEQMLQNLSKECQGMFSAVTDSDKKNILANVVWINNKIETEDNSLFNQFFRIKIGTIEVPEAISNYKDPRLGRSERTPLFQKTEVPIEKPKFSVVMIELENDFNNVISAVKKNNDGLAIAHFNLLSGKIEEIKTEYPKDIKEKEFKSFETRLSHLSKTLEGM